MAEGTMVPPREAKLGRQATPRKGSVLAGWLSSTDHKVIGYPTQSTSFA